MLHLRPGYSQL